MASAGLLHILHSGLQDERLSSKETIEPFKKAFLRAGRFTTEWARIDFDNSPAFGSVANATLPRRGHLITKAFLVTSMPDIRTAQTQAAAWCSANSKQFVGPTIGWTNSIGHALITQAQVRIGAAPIDTLDGRLLEVLDEFHTPLEKVTTVNRLLGRYDSGFAPGSNGLATANQQVVTPLPFWFARGDPSAALPIDAIGTDSVQISITFNTVANLYVSTARSLDGQGRLTQPPLPSTQFYYTDPSGTLVPGLTGDPSVSSRVSAIPGIQLSSTASPGSPASVGSLTLPSAYLLVEYVYLDKPEANRIRLSDLTYPIVQHYAVNPFNTRGAPTARIPIRIPNLVRDMYCMVHRDDADLLNAPFLATRDLSGLPMFKPQAPWWPDASGLQYSVPAPLIPAYSMLDSEPITSLALLYEGQLVRYATDSPSFFRSILQSYEQRKTPWHNKYYYHLPFGTQNEQYGITNPMGHANLDTIGRVELSLQFKPFRGSVNVTDVPFYTVYIWAETYAILRVYNGRAGLLFGY